MPGSGGDNTMTGVQPGTDNLGLVDVLEVQTHR